MNRVDVLGLRDLSSQEQTTVRELRQRAESIQSENPDLAKALKATATDFEILIESLAGDSNPTRINVLNAGFEIWTTPKLANRYNGNPSKDVYMCSPFVKRSLYVGGVTGFGEPTAGTFTNGGDRIGKANLKIVYSLQNSKNKTSLEGWEIFNAETVVNVRQPMMGDIVSHGVDGSTEANYSHIGIYLGHGIYLNATVTSEPNAVGVGYTIDGHRVGNVMIKFIPKNIIPGHKMVFRSVE